MLTNQHHYGYTNLNAAKIKIKFQTCKRSNQNFFLYKKISFIHFRKSFLNK